MNNDDETYLEIGDDDSEFTGDCTVSSELEKENLHHLQKVLHLVQAHRDKSLRTTSSVRNGSNLLELFWVRVGTETEPLQWVLSNENRTVAIGLVLPPISGHVKSTILAPIKYLSSDCIVI
jgi:hypothetical protein